MYSIVYNLYINPLTTQVAGPKFYISTGTVSAVIVEFQSNQTFTFSYKGESLGLQLRDGRWLSV